VYYLAAERLLRDLDAMQPAAGPEEHRLFLRATACEIYNDTVFDLLGQDRVACTLRIDDTGTLRVLRPAVCAHDSEQDAAQVDSLLAQLTEEQRAELHAARDRMDAMGIPSVWDGSLHSTDVTRSDGLRSVDVHRPEDLDAIGRTMQRCTAGGWDLDPAHPKLTLPRDPAAGGCERGGAHGTGRAGCRKELAAGAEKCLGQPHDHRVQAALRGWTEPDAARGGSCRPARSSR
jgi:hypothetical protein